MQQSEKVAVLLPVYKKDKEGYFVLSIDSILNQTYKNIHVFVGVDGPVGDELVTCLKEYEKKDNVSIVWFEQNRGLACVLNDLLDISFKQDFKFIARMDADDISMPERIEKQMDFLRQHKDIDVVGGAIEEIDENGKSRGKIIKYPITSDDCIRFFEKRNPIAHPTVMFRKRFFEKTESLYPTDFIRNEDTRLWHEGFKNDCKMANISDVVLMFRVTSDMFKHRRNGKEFAKSQLKLRKLIAKDLHFGLMSYVYAYATYLLMISPSWVLSLAYRIFR